MIFICGVTTIRMWQYLAFTTTPPAPPQNPHKQNKTKPNTPMKEVVQKKQGII